MKKFPLYFQVLIAVFFAILFGIFFPNAAQQMKPLGDGFIRLIKMCIAPIIFCTVVGSFAGENHVKIGRLSIKAIIYFEILTTLALFVGLGFAFIFTPGKGMNIDLASLDASSLAQYHKPKITFTEFILNIIPETIFQAFVSGEILPILFVSIIFGFALNAVKSQVPMSLKAIEELSKIIFKIISMLVKLAPIGVFGAMSFTVGKYGISALTPLLKFVATFYGTCIFFIIVVFGTILKCFGVSIFKLLKHIKEEIFVVLGTSSSETVLPNMLKKMQDFGCKKSVVSFVLPAGYALNLDGTSIYFTMAIMFIAQVFNIDLSWVQIFQIIFVLLLTSKGSAGVVGSAFITLALTLSVMPTVPIEGLVLILGIDRFMSEARAITNLVGNATATIVLDRLENST